MSVSSWYITFTENHWSNEVTVDYLEKILFPCISRKGKKSRLTQIIKCVMDGAQRFFPCLKLIVSLLWLFLLTAQTDSNHWTLALSMRIPLWTDSGVVLGTNLPAASRRQGEFTTACWPTHEHREASGCQVEDKSVWLREVQSRGFCITTKH